MPAAATLVAYTLTAAALLMVPGPSVVHILSQGFRRGRATALTATLGVVASTAVYVLVTALGLTAGISPSSPAFRVVEAAGASFLVYLAVREFRSQGPLSLTVTAHTRRKTLADALLVGLTNPKIALFFLAILPHHIHPGDGPVALQSTVLGAVFVALAAAVYTGYAVAAGRIADLLARRPGLWGRIHHLSGGVYLVLAAVVAASAATGHS